MKEFKTFLNESTVEIEVSIYSETLELSWNIEPNRTESNFFNTLMFLLSSVRFGKREKF
jgi:hypothetical protein